MMISSFSHYIVPPRLSVFPMKVFTACVHTSTRRSLQQNESTPVSSPMTRAIGPEPLLRQHRARFSISCTRQMQSTQRPVFLVHTSVSSEFKNTERVALYNAAGDPPAQRIHLQCFAFLPFLLLPSASRFLFESEGSCTLSRSS